MKSKNLAIISTNIQNETDKYFMDEEEKMNKDLKCILDPSKFGKMKQKRLIDKGHMSIPMIERWISEFIIEYEKTHENKFNKLTKKSPLQRYKVDRTDLKYLNIDNNTIDQIYKCLFVQSVGFFDFLTELLSKIEDKNSIKSRIWVVFNMLLEHCCRNEFESTMNAVREEMNNEIRDTIYNSEQEIKYLKEYNTKVIEKNVILLNDIEKLENSTMNYKTLTSDLKQKLERANDMHEREVVLRLLQETKLENLNSLHREMESRFMTVAKEFNALTLSHSKQFEQNKNQANEIYSMNKKFKEQESELFHLREQNLLKSKMILAKDQNMASLKKEADDANQKYKSIKKSNDTLMVENKLKVTDATLAKEAQNTINSDREYKISQIHDYLDIMSKQEEKIKSLTSQLKMENGEGLNVENATLVLSIELKDLKAQLNLANNEKNYITEAQKSTLARNNRLEIENNKYKFELQSIQKEFMDNVVKNNIMNEQRKTNENHMSKMLKTCRDQEDQIASNNVELRALTVETRRLKDSIQRMTIHQEQQDNTIITLETLISNMKINNENNMDLFKRLLNKERKISNTYRIQLETQQDTNLDLEHKISQYKDQNKKYEYEKNSTNIEINQMQAQLKNITTKYNELKRLQVEKKLSFQVWEEKASFFQQELANAFSDKEEALSLLSKDQFDYIEQTKCNLENALFRIEDYHIRMQKDMQTMAEMNMQLDQNEETRQQLLKQIKDLEDVVEQKRSTIQSYDQTIFKLSDNLKDEKNLVADLNNKLRIMKNKEEQFKHEIKEKVKDIDRQMTVVSNMNNDITELASIRKKLKLQTDASASCKEVSQFYSASIKKQSCQTVLTVEFLNSKLDKKKVDEIDDTKKDNILHLKQVYETLREEFEEFKDKTQKENNKVCSHCNRALQKEKPIMEKMEKKKYDNPISNMGTIRAEGTVRLDNLDFLDRQSMRDPMSKNSTMRIDDKDIRDIIGRSKTLKIDSITNEESLRKYSSNIKSDMNSSKDPISNMGTMRFDQTEIKSIKDSLFESHKFQHPIIIDSQDDDQQYKSKREMQLKNENTTKFKRRSNIAKMIGLTINNNTAKKQAMSRSVNPTPLRNTTDLTYGHTTAYTNNKINLNSTMQSGFDNNNKQYKDLY